MRGVSVTQEVECGPTCELLAVRRRGRPPVGGAGGGRGAQGGAAVVERRAAPTQQQQPLVLLHPSPPLATCRCGPCASV